MTVSTKGKQTFDDAERGNMVGSPYQGVQLEYGGPASTTIQQPTQQAHTAEAAKTTEQATQEQDTTQHLTAQPTDTVTHTTSQGEASHDS